MKRRRGLDDWMGILLAVLVWIALSANCVAMIDRYSPILSWQGAVVFGGAIVVGLYFFRITKP